MPQLKKFKLRYWWAKLHHPSRPKRQRSVHDGDEENLQCASASVVTSASTVQTHPDGKNGPNQTFLTENHHNLVEPGEVHIRELWDVSVSSDTVLVNTSWQMTLRLPRYGRLQQENPKLIEKYEDSIRHNGDLGTALASILVVGPMKREQMEYVLMRKMEQVNRDAWKLKFGDSTDVEVKDIVEPVLKVVDKANDFITNALDGNPQASIAWAGVSLSLPLLLNPSKQAASLAKGLEYISRLIVQNQLREDLYVRYEKQPADDEVWKRSHKTFKDHLEKLYRQILCLQAEAYCYYSSNSALRIVRDMARWDDWEALLIRVQEQEQAFLGVNELFKDGKYREECEAAERRHRETEGTWKSIGADLSNLHKAIEDARSDKDRVELLNWLCKVDHSKLFNAARDRHQDGTNKWLIKDNDTFKQWEKRPHSFLWLHGKAGSGKSIISSSVIEYIDERIDSETALVYFFFSFTDPANQGTDIMFSSLIKQLCTARPNTPKPIENFRGRYKERGTRPPTEKLEEAFLAAVTGFSSVHIVLNGLDECPAVNNERLKLLKSLDRVMGNSPSSIHVLCTSRNQADIAGYMVPLSANGQGDVIDLHNGVHRQVLDHDIGSYIESTLQSPDFEHFTTETKKKVQDRLVENADGMFQYVYLQMDELRKAFDQESVSQALGNLAMGLDETYQRIFSAIDSKHELNVKRILMWLAFGPSRMREKWFHTAPLRFDSKTLAELCAIRPDDSVVFDERNKLFPDSILKTMPGLIVVDRNGEIRIAHYSIQQYLLSSQIREGPAAPFAFSESDANFFLGHSCLALHVQRNNGGSDSSLIGRNTGAQLWPYHLNMVPHEHWPENVKRKALGALTARSKSLAIMVWEYGYTRGRSSLRHLAYKSEPGLIMLRQPQCFTAFKGFSNFTGLLLSDCLPGTNQYFTRDDYDMVLHYAAAGGCTDIFEKILDMGVGVNVIIEPCSGIFTTFVRNATTPLMAALDRSHLSTSELLLQCGADINARDTRGRSSLQRAVEQRNMDVVRFLLDDRGADLDVQDNDGCSALRVAFLPMPFENPEMGMLLYERGADHKLLPLAVVVRTSGIDCLKVFLDEKTTNINQSGPDQLTALHEAAGASSYKDAFDLLLSYGADVNATSEQHGTPLHQACISGTVECVVSLLKLQKYRDVSCTLWGTALQAACRSREEDLIMDEQSSLIKVKALNDAGANVNAQGGLYENALQAAAVSRLPRVMKLLLDHGANVNKLGGEYGTALEAACANGARLDIVKLLLDSGAHVNTVGGEFGTALQAACSFRWRNSPAVVEVLLEHGAEVNISGGRCGCALQAACCKHDRFESVKLLLHHGADPNIYGGKYTCSLSATVAESPSQKPEWRLQILIEHGADVNYKGGRVGTPLQAACMSDWRRLATAETLLTHGANASARAGRYGTPLHAVLMRRSMFKYEDAPLFINALLRRGADINDNGGPGGITALQGLLEKEISEEYADSGDTDYEKACKVIEYLVEKGADPNLGGGKYGFPLQSACALQERTEKKRAQKLLELCPEIDIHAEGGYFHTSLQAAAYTGQTEPIQILIDRGADVNARGGPYGSALNAAVVRGFWDIVKTLMEAGAKPDCEIFPSPDQLWLWRLEEDDGRAAVRRYEKFWAVESGQKILVVSILAWLGIVDS